MNPKQRVLKALSFQEPDKVPLDFWVESSISQILISQLGLKSKDDLLDFFQIDLRYIEGSVYRGPELFRDEYGTTADIWGVKRKKKYIDEAFPEKGYYENVIEHPLAFAESIRDIEKYPWWPEADWYDYSRVESFARAYPQHAVVCGGDRLNRTSQLKPSMYLRGVSQILMDLATNPVMVEAINEKLVEYYLDYNERIFKNAGGAIDIFFMGDDFGTQNSLMMSIDMWKRFYKKGFKKFIDLAHKYGIKVMHHSCGAIEPLIPEFIECGLDILQSLQPRAKGMDHRMIKKKYGRYICFQGGIDIQHTMPHTGRKEIEEEVKKVISDMSGGGGYIFCTSHNIQSDTPLENILVLYEVAVKYAIY